MNIIDKVRRKVIEMSRAESDKPPDRSAIVLSIQDWEMLREEMVGMSRDEVDPQTIDQLWFMGHEVSSA